jgi:hypothetical protein
MFTKWKTTIDILSMAKDFDECFSKWEYENKYSKIYDLLCHYTFQIYRIGMIDIPHNDGDQVLSHSATKTKHK